MSITKNVKLSFGNAIFKFEDINEDIILKIMNKNKNLSDIFINKKKYMKEYGSVKRLDFEEMFIDITRDLKNSKCLYEYDDINIILNEIYDHLNSFKKSNLKYYKETKISRIIRNEVNSHRLSYALNCTNREMVVKIEDDKLCYGTNKQIKVPLVVFDGVMRKIIECKKIYIHPNYIYKNGELINFRKMYNIGLITITDGTLSDFVSDVFGKYLNGEKCKDYTTRIVNLLKKMGFVESRFSNKAWLSYVKPASDLSIVLDKYLKIK